MDCQEENSIYCKNNENIKPLVGKFQVPNTKLQIKFNGWMLWKKHR